MSDLLPCPFCGKKAMTWSSFSGWHIGCVIPSGIYRVGEMPVQHVLGPFHNEAEAIAAWNTRPTAPVEARGEVHIHVDGAIAKTNGLLLDSLFEKGAPFEGRCKECLNIGHTIIHYRGHVIGNVPCANGCPEREPAPVSQGAGTEGKHPNAKPGCDNCDGTGYVKAVALDQHGDGKHECFCVFDEPKHGAKPDEGKL